MEPGCWSPVIPPSGFCASISAQASRSSLMTLSASSIGSSFSVDWIAEADAKHNHISDKVYRVVPGNGHIQGRLQFCDNILGSNQIIVYPFVSFREIRLLKRTPCSSSEAKVTIKQHQDKFARACRLNGLSLVGTSYLIVLLHAVMGMGLLEILVLNDLA